jgi:hypothetical protein
MIVAKRITANSFSGQPKKPHDLRKLIIICMPCITTVLSSLDRQAFATQ